MLCQATDLNRSGLNGMAPSPNLTSFLVDRANPCALLLNLASLGRVKR